jgi:hypothetical protein
VENAFPAGRSRGVTVAVEGFFAFVWFGWGQADAPSWQISDNLIAGGGYTIYGGQNPGGPQAHNIRITGNRFATLYFQNGGFWGPVAAFDPSGPGNVWSGNVWDSTGQPVSD